MFAGGSFFGGLAQSETIGEVGSIDIPRQEFVYRFQSEVEAYLRTADVATAGEVPPAVAQRISLRVQNELLSYYLMQMAVKQKGVHAPDSAVAEEIRNTPDFHDENGDFSPALYRQFVTDRRYYQERVRESIAREPIFRAMSGFPQEYVEAQVAKFRRQQRVVDEALLPIARLNATVNITEDDINLYYQQNSREYRVREEAGFEYFTFSLDGFAATVEVDEADIRAAYEDFTSEGDRFSRRRVSHIYIEDGALAEEVAEQAIAAPEEFSALVAQYSEDAFSADSGGELGIFVDGDLPPALNDVVFEMDAGEVSDPVETEQGGFSILKLDEIIRDKVPPLEEVRADMVRQARRIAAQDGYDAVLEDIRNEAPLEFGSLERLAEMAGTEVEQQLTVYRTAERNDAPFDSEVVVSDAFGEQVIEEGENSEPIPLENGSYLFVRAVRYQPPGLRPLAEVRDEIHNLLRATYFARELSDHIAQYRAFANRDTLDADGAGDADDAGGAVAEAPAVGTLGEAALAAHELIAAVEWGTSHTLAISDQDELDEQGNDITFDSVGADEMPLEAIAIDEIFAADISYGLPAYAFVPSEEGIHLFRVREIKNREPQENDHEVVNSLFEQMSAQVVASGYLDELVTHYDYSFYNVPEVLGQRAQ